MNLRKYIQDWLGITELQRYANAIIDRDDIRQCQLTRLEDSSRTLAPALGRIIAKLDPTFGQPELDPARKAASDKLADEVLSRLTAEQAVRDHYHYTPNKD